jgi:hypothetical protein
MQHLQTQATNPLTKRPANWPQNGKRGKEEKGRALARRACHVAFPHRAHH